MSTSDAFGVWMVGVVNDKGPQAGPSRLLEGVERFDIQLAHEIHH